jgi:enamine deaminase RidA (YjgF/YER057c/UK114 family)
VQLFTPAGLSPDVPYHHVAVGTGTRQVHVAGHVGRTDADLAGQVADALRNVAAGLAGAGATFADVVRLTVYVTQWRPEKMADLIAGIERVATEIALPLPLPPASLIGVAVLFEPDVQVEIEATAVLP